MLDIEYFFSYFRLIAFAGRSNAENFSLKCGIDPNFLFMHGLWMVLRVQYGIIEMFSGMSPFFRQSNNQELNYVSNVLTCLWIFLNGFCRAPLLFNHIWLICCRLSLVGSGSQRFWKSLFFKAMAKTGMDVQEMKDSVEDVLVDKQEMYEHSSWCCSGIAGG